MFGNHASYQLLLITIILALCALPGMAGQNMIGNQSQNEGLQVLPAPGKVTVDGDLSEWDWSGRIWSFADTAVRARYSVEVAAMWDMQNLYLAAKWKDPTPMFNAINPAFNPEEGWKSDCWQMRIKTDQIIHLTAWYYTAEQMSCMQVTNATAGTGGYVLRKANGADLGKGVEQAFKRDADGRGYVQEIKVPWALLYQQAPEIKAGLTFRLGNEYLWGDVTGKAWPIHRYADNMQPGATSREFYWTNTNAWGNAVLQGNGNVPVRQYINDATRLPGTVPVRATIPQSATRFTIAINDAHGTRIRNLAGDFDPADYTVAQQGDQRTVEVLWDCLDDHGKLVPPGNYQIVGLSQGGLRAEYDMCFYNPGTPSWENRAGNGSWGADHSAPQAVAASGDWMLVSWLFAEGGSGLIGVGPDGLKRWGEKRGINAMAADSKYVYAITNSWYTSGTLCRFTKDTGMLTPFVVNNTARPAELPMGTIFGTADTATQAGIVPKGGELALAPTDAKTLATVALAAHGDTLALAMNTGELALLDINTAVPKQVFMVGALTALAFSDDGKLYGVRNGRVCAINLTTGALTAIATPGVGTLAAMTIDHTGNIVVADTSADCRVKAFTPAGKLAYTAGKKGGRAVRGTFDPQGMRAMTSVAVDAGGRIWVVESSEYPRRVSVWGRNGKLVRDYIGNTGYAGTDCFLHDEDPTLAYAGPVEMKLDRATHTWKVTRVLWVPDAAQNECFEASPHSGGDWGQSTIITSSASGKKRSYLFSYKNGPQVVFLQRGKVWQPVSAICLVEHIIGDGKTTLAAQFADLNKKDGIFWNDLNADGKVARNECTVVKGGLKLGAEWSGRMGSDLSIFCSGLVRYRPIGFTKDGAPLYGPAGMKDLGTGLTGSLVPVTDENLLLCLSYNNYPNETAGMVGVDSTTGAIRWTYPNLYPNVHGSHRATMPKPGLLIGSQKICGVANVNAQVGNVFLIRGNLGQDFLFTTDGLYVGSLFQDGRLPADALPETEAELRGMPMENFSEGGEPFNGWFGKQSDGKIRLTTGMARQAAMILEIKGLESIRRFTAPALEITPALAQQAERDNAARVAAATAPASYTVKQLTPPIAIDANPAKWAQTPAMAIERDGSPNKGTLKMGYDVYNLYVLFEVQDASPWLNEGKDYTRLFKTGDAVDLQFNTNPATPAKRGDVRAGDVRLVFSQYNGKPVVVLMKPIDPTAPPELRFVHHSPVMEHSFDRIQVLDAAKIAVTTTGTGYVVEAAVPLSAIGLTPTAGMVLHGDAGIISSDAQGIVNVARTYWSNKATNLVNDLPSEAWLYPDTWGELRFE